MPLDSSPSSLLDTFVTLSDEAGNRREDEEDLRELEPAL